MENSLVGVAAANRAAADFLPIFPTFSVSCPKKIFFFKESELLQITPAVAIDA